MWLPMFWDRDERFSFSHPNVSKVVRSADSAAIYDRSQLRKNCFFTRRPKNPDAFFAIDET